MSWNNLIPNRKIGANEPCGCGSGIKFKKCCGPRGGLTQLVYDEEQAYREAEARRPKQPSAFMPMLHMLAATGYTFPIAPSVPRPPIGRGSRGRS